MKTLVNGKSVEQPHPPNELSQIITHAKKLHARNQVLEIGGDRKDADLRVLRDALAKERRRFSWAEFVLGSLLTLAVYALALFVWPTHHG